MIGPSRLQFFSVILLPSLRRKDGYSLVELMITVAIIGLLTVIANQQFTNFKVRAMRTEAQKDIGSLRALIASYQAESERLPYTFPTNEVGPGLLDANWYPLVADDVSTDISCQVQNVFGFSVSDCRKVRYSYWYIANSLPNEFAIGAWNNGKVCKGGKWAGESLAYCPSTRTLRKYKDGARNACENVVVDTLAGCQGRD